MPCPGPLFQNFVKRTHSYWIPNSNSEHFSFSRDKFNHANKLSASTTNSHDTTDLTPYDTFVHSYHPKIGLHWPRDPRGKISNSDPCSSSIASSTLSEWTLRFAAISAGWLAGWHQQSQQLHRKTMLDDRYLITIQVLKIHSATDPYVPTVVRKEWYHRWNGYCGWGKFESNCDYTLRRTISVRQLRYFFLKTIFKLSRSCNLDINLL